MMKCAAIVVTYNGIKWYEKCFGSLLVVSGLISRGSAAVQNSKQFVRLVLKQIH
jgi:hypothetical protein